MKKILKDKRGYTFFELIVVLTIFSVLGSIVASIFVLFSRAQARTIATQTLVSDLRFVTESIAREVRNGRIDYSQYSVPITSPQTELYIIDQNSNTVVFRLVQDRCPEEVSQCIEVTKNGISTIATSDNTNIKDIKFYIYPSDDPFSFDQGVFLANDQPGVTFSLEAEAVRAVGNQPVDVELQTTISSKQYLR